MYEKKTGWNVIMDHLTFVHDIAKDAKHPSILSKQVKEARVERKQHALGHNWACRETPVNEPRRFFDGMTRDTSRAENAPAVRV